MDRGTEDGREFARWNEEMAHKFDPEDYHMRSHFLIRWYVVRCRVLEGAKTKA